MDLLFVLDGCEVAQRAVEPLAVVEDLDELDDGPADLGDRGPRLPVDQLFLEGREPAFTNGVGPRRQLHPNRMVKIELFG